MDDNSSPELYTGSLHRTRRSTKATEYMAGDDDHESTAELRIIGTQLLSLAAGDPDNVLRPFTASLSLSASNRAEAMHQSISGWIAWRPMDHELCEAGDRLESEAFILGLAADQIIGAHPELPVSTVLLLNNLSVEQTWPGGGLTRSLLKQMREFLRLSADTTLVVFLPESKASYDSFGDEVIDVDAFAESYEEQGLPRWGDSTVRWLPIDDVTL